MTGARAFWVVGPGRGELRTETLTAPGDGQVLVETLFSGVSRGTESLVFGGRVPASQATAMRCPFQVGSFPAPVKYGYACVGRIAGGDPRRLGQRVFCLHPHQDRFLVPGEAAVAIPDAVPSGRAVLAANMETALNALWDAGVPPGGRVAVVGLGVVGLLTGYLLARRADLAPVGVDPDPARRALAETLGLTSVESAAAATFDTVVHASGNPQGLVDALAMAAFEATVLELSWYGTRPVTLPLGEAFHSRRLTIRASQVGTVAPARRAGWSHRRRLARALELLDDDRLDALVDSECGLDELPRAMAELADGSRPALCHRVRYPAAEL